MHAKTPTKVFFIICTEKKKVNSSLTYYDNLNVLNIPKTVAYFEQKAALAFIWGCVSNL